MYFPGFGRLMAQALLLRRLRVFHKFWRRLISVFHS